MNVNVKVFNLMLRVNKTRFLIQDKLCQCKYGLSKSVCSLKKNKIIMNVAMGVKNQMIGVRVKMIICGILTHAILIVMRYVKLKNIQVSKIAHVKNVSLVSKCQHMKIRLNTTETTKKAKKCEKNIDNAITS